jgi:hypothetical protein
LIKQGKGNSELEGKDGHLFKDNRLDFEAKEDALLVVITS